MSELSARPTRAIKVAQIGTGNVGRHALTQLITDPGSSSLPCGCQVNQRRARTLQSLRD